ncbi:MAG: YerC/YecD family TrpR-related protein [Patescibacteria group bacterium]
MPARWETPKLKRLVAILGNLKTEKEMLAFLRDLCTLEELAEISSRWQAVELLDKNLPYREIADQTGLSTTTVTRVAHWLYHGEGGYRVALSKLKAKL